FRLDGEPEQLFVGRHPKYKAPTALTTRGVIRIIAPEKGRTRERIMFIYESHHSDEMFGKLGLLIEIVIGKLAPQRKQKVKISSVDHNAGISRIINFSLGKLRMYQKRQRDIHLGRFEVHIK